MTGKLSQFSKDSHGCFINKKRPKGRLLLKTILVIQS
jgi:hypothetical protein